MRKLLIRSLTNVGPISSKAEPILSACVTLLQRKIGRPDALDVLLVKRKFAPKKGFWGLPGGKFDPVQDKTLADTARREMLEETNISVKVQKDYYYKHAVGDGKYLLHHFLARGSEAMDLSFLVAETDAEQIEWVDVDLLINNAWTEPIVENLPDVLKRAKSIALQGLIQNVY
jgi:ADP-ribose pyrophosphatase YjhB (NUDIX family)